jgi:hypothetical protein
MRIRTSSHGRRNTEAPSSKSSELDVRVHTCNPSTQEAEAERMKV